ncbi:hypothetical protein BROUX41_005779 [Berkeleyomyces rouxiae]|uniref:uncharacterized protein n=1 Tax=Berkeleyomyces rouxiae TaxID=2035830 RepID=UPI003B7CC198
MWLNIPANSGLNRSRVAFFAAISALSLASLGYYVYQLRTVYPLQPGLRRQNATRRRPQHRQRRRTRAVDEDAVETTSIVHSDSETLEYPNPDDNHGPGQRSSLFEQDQQYEEQTDLRAETVDGEVETADDFIDSLSRAGHNIVGLLFRVSEDNARRNAYVHRGCQCNACSTVPIRGIRYRCINCADFDLCEACESQGLHNKNHVFLKIKVPVPPAGLRTIQPVLYTGDPDNCVKTLPKAIINRLCRETGFERANLEAHWERWTFMANTEWREDPDDLCLAMDRKTFDRCIVHTGTSRHLPPNLVHDRIFAFFDQNGDGLISFREYLHGLAYRSKKERLRKVFDGYDIDGDGYVDRKDFLRMFRAYFTIFKQIHKDILDGLDAQVMSLLDTQQLINGRTPLSSFFGRDDAVPHADLDESRTAGKALQPDGSVSLPSPLPHVVQSSEQEAATRADILSAVFTINIADGSTRAGSLVQNILPNALLSPPDNINALLNLITRVSGGSDQADQPTNHFISQDLQNIEHSNHDNTITRLIGEVVNTDDATCNSPNIQESTSASPHDQELSEGERELQRRVRRQMFERWRRRQFYLDAEEGAQVPSGWDSDEDIVERINAMANPELEPTHNTRRDSTRSRSSSKVRFADEDDEFDTRSNASTSSRNVPERWGGYDIPEAERDLGKEILYLTAQEAYNEMLDAFFKEKEDLAVKAAETRDPRHFIRDLLENLPPQDASESSKPHTRDAKKSTSGCSNNSGNTSDEGASTGNPNQRGTVDSSSLVNVAMDQASHHSSPSLRSSVQHDGNEPGNRHGLHLMRSNSGDAIYETPDHARQSYRDPTMPQFRPNSVNNHTESAAPTGNDSKMATFTTTTTSDSERKFQLPHIEEATLRKWRQYHDAEMEAVRRHGFGKLSFAEFEKIYREQETQRRMDYLETWIDIYMP